MSQGWSLDGSPVLKRLERSDLNVEPLKAGDRELGLCLSELQVPRVWTLCVELDPFFSKIVWTGELKRNREKQEKPAA